MRPELPSDPPLLGVQTPRGPVVYTDEGAGPVIVAVHGAPGGTGDWRWLGAALDRRVRFIRVALPGLGETPLLTEHGTSFEARASLILEVLDELGVERAHWIGHSMGGGICVSAAHLAPNRVLGVGLLASLGLRPHHGLEAGHPKLSWRLVSLPILGRLLRPVLPRAFAALGFPKGVSVDVLLRCLHLAAEVDVPGHGSRVRDLPVPALVAWTQDDRLIAPAISDELAQAAPDGPRLCWETGGHFLLKTRAVELADALVDWVGPTV
jgi:pyruvate dehydrogenase E2 component (dihydrolipoamide acetyltransferase)